MKMKVLVACEFSGIVRDAFAARGHEAWSVDLLETEKEGNHHQGDALEMIHSQPWDLLIAHPPCTYLANSSVGWLHDHVPSKNGALTGSARWVEMFAAAEFFNALKNAPVDRIAVENPIPHKYARALIGKYSQIIQPWMFGHGETKATCLWLKNLPNLEPTIVVDGRQQRSHWESPGPDRWKNRSRTMQGIADAMAEQWGAL